MTAPTTAAQDVRAIAAAALQVTRSRAAIFGPWPADHTFHEASNDAAQIAARLLVRDQPGIARGYALAAGVLSNLAARTRSRRTTNPKG